jgi:hypothetical protein
MQRGPGRMMVRPMTNDSSDTAPIVEKLRERKHLADVDEDEKTPAVLIAETWVVIATAALVVLANSLLAYRLAA